jgi:hypothetical protein
MGQHVEAVLTVVVADACRACSAERHRLDEQVDVDLIHRAAAVGELADEPVDGLLIAAEDESSERMRRCSDAGQSFVERFVGEDW